MYIYYICIPPFSILFSNLFSYLSPHQEGTYIREVRVFFNTDHLHQTPTKMMEENPRTPRKNGDSFTKKPVYNTLNQIQ